MKRFRFTFILIIILVSLGVYVYFFERGEIKEPPSSEVTVFSLNKDKIKEIELKAPSREIKFVKLRDRWWITKPAKFLAGKEEMENLIDELSPLVAERKISEKYEDISGYGLFNPQLEIIVRLNDNKEKVLLVGNKNPIGSLYYIKEKDKSAVYTIPVYQMEKFNQTATDYREKRILFLKKDTIIEVEIKKDKKKVKFHKRKKGKEDKWYKVKDKSKKDKTDDIQQLLTQLEELRAVEFIDEPENLVSYGLKPPIYSLALMTKNKRKYYLFLGKKEGTFIYAKTKKDKPIYKIYATLKDAMNKLL